MDSQERRKLVMERLHIEGRVLVSELSALCEASEMTVRRDLERLEREGALRRVHGGAVTLLSRGYEPPFIVRAATMQREKELIAAAASELVAPGDVVMVDSGTTALEVARVLSRKESLTVVTPSQRVIEVLQVSPSVRVISTGGVVRPGELSLSGELAARIFEDLFCDIAFIGAGGIDADAGATEYSMDDAVVKRAAARSARRVVVVADGTKVGSVAVARICAVTQVYALITDSSADASAVERLREQGVVVTVV